MGARGDVASGGVALLAAWSEPHRAYHDRRHLAEVLERVDELAAWAGDPDAVRLASWFHDAVYEPSRADNEARSAVRAERLLAALSVSPVTVREVARLVRLTAAHAPAPGDRDGAVLCDADLAILAAAPARYAEYAADVRREYALVSEPAFAAGRSAVLRTLLERSALFRSPPARAWEARARANVATELERLAAPG